MIVTDLHGDLGSYQAYLNRFEVHQARGEADFLVLCGDLIHSSGPAHRDHSLDIILDVIDQQNRLGDRLIWLLGNHEMPHIYGVSLVRGTNDYTPRFEASLGDHRQVVLDAFKSLPFFLRTKAGWSVAHAGAAHGFSSAQKSEMLFNFSHQTLIDNVRSGYSSDSLELFQEVYERQGSVPYEEAVRYWLAVEDRNDPRFNDLAYSIIISSREADFELLWDTLMNKNEFQYGAAQYETLLDQMLGQLSNDFWPQQALIAGHITCANGHEIVCGRQLRMASGIHSKPLDSARYLLLDAAEPIESVQDLLPGLRSIH